MVIIGALSAAFRLLGHAQLILSYFFSRPDFVFTQLECLRAPQAP